MISRPEGDILIELLEGDVPAPLDFITAGLKLHQVHQALILFFTGPILISDLHWVESGPLWLKRAIRVERLKMILAESRNKTVGKLSTLPEALMYLCSLEAGLQDDWTGIYGYVAWRVMDRYHQKMFEREACVLQPDKTYRLNQEEARKLRLLQRQIRREVVWRSREMELASPPELRRYSQIVPEEIGYDYATL